MVCGGGEAGYDEVTCMESAGYWYTSLRKGVGVMGTQMAVLLVAPPLSFIYSDASLGPDVDEFGCWVNDCVPYLSDVAFVPWSKWVAQFLFLGGAVLEA